MNFSQASSIFQLSLELSQLWGVRISGTTRSVVSASIARLARAFLLDHFELTLSPRNAHHFFYGSSSRCTHRSTSIEQSSQLKSRLQLTSAELKSRRCPSEPSRPRSPREASEARTTENELNVGRVFSKTVGVTHAGCSNRNCQNGHP